AKVTKLICSKCANTSEMIMWILLLRGMSIPNKFLNWLNPMIKAAAEVNPAITGCDKKLIRNPSRKKPSNIWMIPAINAVAIASTTNSFVQGSANLLTPDNTSSGTSATGPTDNCRELPKIAYNNSG